MTSLTRIAIHAYMDGFTGVGLFRKLDLPYDWSLSLVDQVDHERDFAVAMSALVAGGIANLVSIGAFAYLTVHDHPKLAFSILGLMVSQIIASLFVRRTQH
jgi:hypothetical protein